MIHPPAQIAQGRLHCTQHSVTRKTIACTLAPRAGLFPSRSFASSIIRKTDVDAFPHGRGSPRQQGQRLHALVDRPTVLTPSSNPRLGVDSHHQRLHRCALNGFLGPSSKKWLLTRILRHQCAYFKVYHNLFVPVDNIISQLFQKASLAPKRPYIFLRNVKLFFKHGFGLIDAVHNRIR